MTERSTMTLGAVATVAALALSGAGPVTSWTVVRSPNPSLSGNNLRGVASVGPGAVWSVGDWRDDTTGRRRTLTQRWDGLAWRIVDSPDTDGNDTLTAVAGTSPADLWAVGYATATGAEDPDRGVPLMLHGDGASWTVDDLAAPGVAGSLAAIDMLGENDGWAVGSYRPDRTAVPRGLILRWSGDSWRAVPAPDGGSRPVHLTGVAGSGPGDVWAVGYTGELGADEQPEVEHWDGQAWRQLKLGSPPQSPSALFGVAAAGDGVVWAVGYRRTAGGRQPYALRWSGNGWQEVSGAAPGDAELHSVVALPAGVWAAGYLAGRSADTALVMSFDGAALTSDPLPPPPASTGNVAGTALSAIAATERTGDLWAVGCLGFNTQVLHRNVGG
ncbi:hypothetical protein ACQP2F_31265 [Actinoplanes sp. CA-030573]|uniref:hypothetical protein n=1 Tax=Actinoplanes sp. CA-030573 TaxID=3239898 RepID=UPI003D92D409